jgi:outer membrane protein
MPSKFPIMLFLLVLWRTACAQTPAAQTPPPGQGQAPRGTQQTAPVPQPGEQPIPKPQQALLPGAGEGAPVAPLQLTMETAIQHATQYSQQVYTAEFAAQLAHEDAVQARAALLPSAAAFSQFIYTQPNGTDTGIFVANNGPRVYTDEAIIHGEVYNPVKRADYRRAIAAEAAARARADLAARGLIATVAQNYYGMLAAQRKLANAQQSLREAQQVFDITQKQEQGGEVAHADVIKAQIQLETRQRDAQEAQLALEKARIGFGVLLFPNYGQEFTVYDDLETIQPLPSLPEIQARMTNPPDIRFAQALVQQQTHALASARSALLPALSFDYFYGINANQFAVYGPDHVRNLGSAVQAQLTIPIFSWGANRSRIRQAEIQLRQARFDLSFVQRQLQAELNQFYAEAQVAASQVSSLRHTMELAAESLRLTLLRYQAGEVTILELVDAQTTLTQARNAYDDGLVRYRVALANVQTLTGIF